jgi:hypothetical protein
MRKLIQDCVMVARMMAVMTTKNGMASGSCCSLDVLACSIMKLRDNGQQEWHGYGRGASSKWGKWKGFTTHCLLLLGGGHEEKEMNDDTSDERRWVMTKNAITLGWKSCGVLHTIIVVVCHCMVPHLPETVWNLPKQVCLNRFGPHPSKRLWGHHLSESPILPFAIWSILWSMIHSNPAQFWAQNEWWLCSSRWNFFLDEVLS